MLWAKLFWVFFQSVIQHPYLMWLAPPPLPRARVVGLALMLYAFRTICKTVEKVGNTLFHLFRWRCTAEPAVHLLRFRLFRKLGLV